MMQELRELRDFDKFTDEQVRLLDKAFGDDLPERFRLALAKAVQAHEAIVPLPHVNEKGVNTIVLCNNLMYSLHESYLEEARVLYYRASRFPGVTEKLSAIREHFAAPYGQVAPGKIRVPFF